MATGTGNLPYPGKVYNPFDILTAEELNEDVANIESLADGTGLGDTSIPTAAYKDGSVTPAKRTGGFYGVTHTFTNATGTQTITGIGFTPKAIQIVGISRSSTSEGQSSSGFCFYNGSTYVQGGTSIYTTSSSPRTRTSTSSACVQTNAAGTGFIWEATVTGFSSNTITFNVVTSSADAGFRSYHIMIFG